MRFFSFLYLQKNIRDFCTESCVNQRHISSLSRKKELLTTLRITNFSKSMNFPTSTYNLNQGRPETLRVGGGASEM